MHCSPSLPAGLRLPCAVLLATLLAANGSLALEPGDQAPDFMLPLLQGEGRKRLEDYQSQIVFVDFWASWCGPCRLSLPEYEALHQELAGENVQILAINLDEEQQDALDFLARHPVSYTVLRDAAASTPAAWQIKAMPSSFLIDGSGQVVRAWAGFEATHIKELRDAISELQAR